MTYALIADIHGNLLALEAVLADARARGADGFIFLGDYAIGQGSPNETLDLLRAIPGAMAVRGNEDEALPPMRGQPSCPAQFRAVLYTANALTAENAAFIEDLPEEEVVRRPGCPPIFAFHKPERYFGDTTPEQINPALFARGMDTGLFDHECFAAWAASRLRADEALGRTLASLPQGVYAFGHRHIQWSAQAGGCLLVSPGSCGQPLDLCPDAPYALLRQEVHGWTVQLCRVPYDIEASLRLLRASDYARDVRVWAGVAEVMLAASRETAYPFLRYADAYASARGDRERPFQQESWEGAYDAWRAENP